MSRYFIYSLIWALSSFSSVRCQISLDTLNQEKVSVSDLSVEDVASDSVRREMQFVFHLNAIGDYSASLIVLEDIMAGMDGFSPSLRDSVYYFHGWTNYYLKNLDEAVELFSLVDMTSDVYPRATFYRAFCLAYLGQLDSAIGIISNFSIAGEDSLGFNSLKNFQLAGYALLKRDFVAFDSCAKHFTEASYSISSEEQELLQYRKDLMKYTRKRAWIAAVYSAVIPGSGKLYAGYFGQPFATFATTMPFAVMAAESFIKSGPWSPQFIALGSMFAVFYVGNIWGSALSVNTRKLEYYGEIDHNILVDLHLPLRRLFE